MQEMLRKKLNIGEDEENDKVEQKRKWDRTEDNSMNKCIFVAITCTFHSVILITCKKNKVTF
jgi:hypothetical protein